MRGFERPSLLPPVFPLPRRTFLRPAARTFPVHEASLLKGSIMPGQREIVSAKPHKTAHKPWKIGSHRKNIVNYPGLFANYPGLFVDYHKVFVAYHKVFGNKHGLFGQKPVAIVTD